MSNELSKAIKRKTDAQFRTMGEDRTPSISEGAGGSVIILDPGQYQIPYVAGKNVTIGTSGNNKVINALMNILAGANITVSAPDENGAVTVSASIGGKPINLSGLMDGYVLKYDSVSDSFIVGEGGGGGLAEMPQATETTLGGIKAKTKTVAETVEAAIDPATGKIYVPASAPLPGYMIQDADGIKVYDSALKTNLVATLGRKSDPAVYSEISHIPAMTSNNSPSGIVSASSYFSGYDAFKAMDQNQATYWSTVGGTSIGWIAYEWATPKKINKYTIKGRADASDGSPKNWTFEGWNGTAWLVLDTRANITWTNGEKKSFTFSNEISFSKYRVNVAANNGRSTLNIAEIEMIEVIGGGYIYGVLTDQYLEKMSGAALPTAAVGYRGKIFTLLGAAGVADAAYICLKDATDTYIWTQI